MEETTMKKRTVLAPVALALLVAASFAPSVQAGGNVDFFAGQKELDRNFGDGNRIEEQDAAAIFTDWGGDTWPVHIALDVLVGQRDRNDDQFDVKLDGSTGEIDVGARWYPAKGSKWMPHVGGGLGLISGEVSTSNPDPANDISFDDSKLGYWADAGLAYRFGDHFKLGSRIRYSKAELDNPEGNVRSVDAGGLTYGVNAGFTW
jgi:opacity protein-like surface antigen